MTILVDVFQLIQTLHWAALSTWFGFAMFIALAAPTIFRIIRENDPTLPRVLSVNLDGQHATLLAGEIVMQLLRLLSRTGMTCAGILVLTTLLHWILLPAYGSNLVSGVIRSTLLLGAIGLLVYDWRVLAPRLNAARQRYIDHADEPDVANEAKDQFDRLQRESVNVLFVLTLLLLGLILFSTATATLQIG